MNEGGRTIAVLGTPLDTTYPTQNRELQDRMMREHLVVSQFPVGSPFQKKNFPMRNRTMALLSDATIIVATETDSFTVKYEVLNQDGAIYVSGPMPADQFAATVQSVLSPKLVS